MGRPLVTKTFPPRFNEGFDYLPPRHDRRFGKHGLAGEELTAHGGTQLDRQKCGHKAAGVTFLSEDSATGLSARLGSGTATGGNPDR